MVKNLFTEEEIALIKREDDLIDTSLIIVSKLFKDKVDKQGVPYIEHLYYVMKYVNTYRQKVLALLHDSIEDTGLELEDLRELGYPEEILNGLDLLTHKEGVSYSEYINRICESNDKDIIRVKLVDMRHNKMKKRLHWLPQDVSDRLLIKYEKPYQLLKKSLERKNRNDRYKAS